VELPTFHGENPRAWLLETEDIFKLVGINGEARVRWGIAHIRGQAKIWLSSSGMDLQGMSWAELGKVLIERFPDTVTVDPMEQLQHLRQRTTVDNYINSYESWMHVMKRGRVYLPTDFFVERFISGLSESIRHLVQCQQPVSLMSAYYMARQYGKNHNANMAGTRRAQPAVPAPPLLGKNAAGQEQQNRNGQPRDNPIRNARPRIPRQCWYCPDNYALGHRCPGMQRAINMLILQEHPEEQEEEVQQLLLDAVQEEQEPILPAHAAQQAHEELPVDDNVHLMQISAAAYHGATDESTISLLIQIKGVPAVALADTGSTNTFLDRQFVMDHDIDITPAPPRRVKVAGGGILVSDSIAYNHQFFIQGIRTLHS
jgi:hypothetical protein